MCAQNFNNVRLPLASLPPSNEQKTNTGNVGNINRFPPNVLYVRYIYIMNFIETPNQFIYVRRALLMEQSEWEKLWLIFNTVFSV